MSRTSTLTSGGKMFRNRKKVDNHTYVAGKSTCHEWTLKYEVEKRKRKTDIVVENKELIMKKEIENNVILRYNTKISSPPYKSE